jgi:hypothetical protein
MELYMLAISEIVDTCRNFGGVPVVAATSPTEGEIWTLSVSEGEMKISETLQFPTVDDVVRARSALAVAANSLKTKVFAERVEQGAGNA